jgi:hypothetical protein
VTRVQKQSKNILKTKVKNSLTSTNLKVSWFFTQLDKVICERANFEPEQIKLTSFTMKESFIKILKDSDLWYWFLNEFDEDWEAQKWYYTGWSFDGDSISYRACDLFDDYSEGYNWNFYQDDYHLTMLHRILLSHGFEETHNSGDEEDGFYRMQLKNS